MRASTEIHIPLSNVHLGCPLTGLFSQARRAYNQITRFFHVFPRVRDEQVSTAVTAEKVGFAFVSAGTGFILANTQPYQ